MGGRPNPRRTNGSRRTKLRKQVAAEGLPCHICGHAIDYSLPAGHPMAYELDEIVPVSKGGSPYDRKNVAPAHRICNERKGNKILKQSVGGAAGHEKKTRVGLPLSQEW